MNEKNVTQFLVNQSVTVLDSLQVIDKLASGLVFIVDGNNKLIGSLSDGDIRRFIISGGSLTKDVENVCNKNCYKVTSIAEIDVGFVSRENIRAVPIINADNQVIGIWSGDTQHYIHNIEVDELKSTKVVIMAGGQGTRLYPITKILPKPLIPIGDTPIAELIIEQFIRFGAKDFIFSVNYKAGMLKAYFNDLEHNDYHVDFIEETQPLGTAGSLYLLKNKFYKTFFVVNCDILIKANYARILKYHKQHKNAITLVGAVKDYQIPYGVIEYCDDGTDVVLAINEKPTYHFTVNSGMYILEPDVLNLIPDNKFFHITDLIGLLISKGGKVGCYPVHGDAWLDMGQFEEMKNMMEKLGIK